MNENPATLSPADLAIAAQAQVVDIRMGRRAAGLVARDRRNWNLYYSRDDGVANWADNLYPEGDAGEKVRMRVNVARNLIKHKLAMVTAKRPVVDPKAQNTDLRSIKQVEIGRAVADHYLKVERLYKQVDLGVEYALVLGAGFVHLWWDDSAGQPFAAPGGQMLYQGDIRARALNTMDAAFDLRASTWEDLTEVTLRTWEDKYELEALYPAESEKILNAPTRGVSGNTLMDDDLPTPGRVMSTMKPTSLIEVCIYYHKATPACPRGRRVKFLQCDGTLLPDRPEYDQCGPHLPVFRITGDEVIGSPIGYAELTDVGALQEFVDKAWSSIATRVFAHGVANVLAKRGANVEVSTLSGGMNLIEYDEIKQGARAPVETLELLKVPPELVKTLELAVQAMEGISGINAVVRGNPPPGVDAGVAIAQFEAMAVQFSTKLEGSYVEAVEGIVLWIFETLAKYAAGQQRIAQLVGKNKRELLKYTGDDLSGICRIDVDMGNPLSRTSAGRSQLADYLRNSGIPITPQQFIEVLNTGNIDMALDPIVSEQDLIAQENDALLDGTPIVAIRGQNHQQHIIGHRRVLNNPDVVFDQRLLAQVEQHLQQHEAMWMMGDPLLGIAMGQIPMGAAAMPPGMGPPGAQPPGAHPSPNGPPGPAHAGPVPPPHAAGPGGPPARRAHPPNPETLGRLTAPTVLPPVGPQPNNPASPGGPPFAQ